MTTMGQCPMCGTPRSTGWRLVVSDAPDVSEHHAEEIALSHAKQARGLAAVFAVKREYFVEAVERMLERAEQLGAEREREACALAAEAATEQPFAGHCAAAIRARQ